MANSCTFHIAWAVPESSFALAEANHILGELGLVAEPVAPVEPYTTTADLLVLHAGQFADLEQLRRAYEQLARPGLIVVDSEGQESQVLQWPRLPLTVDICRADALRGQLVDRLRRLLEATCHEAAWETESQVGRGLQKYIHGREYLDIRLAREFTNARKHCRSLSVAWLELTGLGQIGDSFGAMAPILVLRAFAHTALGSIRIVDWLAEYGDGAYCLVMPDTWLDEGAVVAERVRERVAALVVRVNNGHTVTPRLEIGVAELTDAEGGFEDLLQKAMEASLLRKIAGRLPAGEGA